MLQIFLETQKRVSEAQPFRNEKEEKKSFTTPYEEKDHKENVILEITTEKTLFD